MERLNVRTVRVTKGRWAKRVEHFIIFYDFSSL